VPHSQDDAPAASGSGSRHPDPDNLPDRGDSGTSGFPDSSKGPNQDSPASGGASGSSRGEGSRGEDSGSARRWRLNLTATLILVSAAVVVVLCVIFFSFRGSEVRDGLCRTITFAMVEMFAH